MNEQTIDRLGELANTAAEEASFGWNFTTEKQGDMPWTDFITACTPEVIRALVAEVRSLREMRAAVHTYAESISDHFGDGWPHTPTCQGEAGCPLCYITEATQEA